jgi:transcriptional regulator with XRE-family HTH domain
MSINDRIRILIDLLANGRQNVFGDATKIKATTINGIIGKKASDPSFSTLKKIIDAYPNIDLNWLMKGEGEPLLTSDDQDCVSELVSDYKESLSKIRNSIYLCSNLKLIRIHLHKTQDSFAQIFGVTRDTIASYERGFKPKLPLLKEAMSYFGISLDELTSCDLKEHPEILEKISIPEEKKKSKN